MLAVLLNICQYINPIQSSVLLGLSGGLRFPGTIFIATFQIITSEKPAVGSSGLLYSLRTVVLLTIG